MTRGEVVPSIGIKDVLALVVLIDIGVGIPLFAAAAAGSIGLPHNDDWVYMRAAKSLFDNGVIDMSGHTASAIGQIVLVQPFLWVTSGEPWAFMAFGLTMASIAIATTYMLARRFVGIAPAVLVVVTLLAFPGFARESASFMTDVPTYALVMLCLLLGTRYLQGAGGPLTLVASLTVGVFAVSIREFAVAAPLAILIAEWARSRAGHRIWLATVSNAAMAGIAVVVSLSRSVPGQGSVSTPVLGHLIDLGPAFATLAAVLLPALLLYLGRHVLNVSAEQVMVGAGLVFAVLFLPDGPLLGNLWRPDGLAGRQLLAGSRPAVIGDVAWGISEQLAVFAAILAAAIALRWCQRNLVLRHPVSSGVALFLRIARSDEGPLALFLVGYAAELALYAFVGGVFDRYLYPMVPVAAILILRRAAGPLGVGRSHAFAHGALAWLIVSSVVLTANSFAYDTARYREGEAAVAMGYTAQTVDAGYEWVGIHGIGPMKPEFIPTEVNWWDDVWPSFRACAILSSSPVEIPAYKLVRVNRAAYKQFLIFGPDQSLYLYGATMEGCPAPVSV